MLTFFLFATTASRSVFQTHDLFYVFLCFSKISHYLHDRIEDCHAITMLYVIYLLQPLYLLIDV